MAQEIITIDALAVSPLVLAYIGDSFYELTVRTHALSLHNSSVERVNNYTKKYTKATAQAAISELITEDLTEKEMHVFKRGRNSKSASVPSSCTVSEYRRATGLEALVGFLYLDGQKERAEELILSGIEKYDMDQEEA